jgi:hypothetical protein
MTLAHHPTAATQPAAAMSMPTHQQHHYEPTKMDRCWDSIQTARTSQTTRRPLHDVIN